MSLFGNLKYFSSNTLVIDENSNTYSYYNLLKNVENIKKIFKPKDTIFLISENSFEFLCCYVSLIKSKSVIYLIEKTIDKKKLRFLNVSYKPKYILSPNKINFQNKLKSISILNNKYFLYKTKHKINYKINKKISILLSTSGSTGSPKFVKLSNLNLFDNANKIANYLKIKSSHKVITTMQPNYSYGLSIINSHLIKGATIIMTEKSLFEKNFWELLKKHKATTFGGVPFIFNILKKIKFEKMNLPHLKYITQAGGKLDKKLLLEITSLFKKIRIKLIVMYGQTEASPRMSYLPWRYLSKKIESIGKPIEGGKFLIYDKNNKIIKKNNLIGELVYKGKNVMLGYAENFKDLNKINNNSKLFTGDLAYRDKDGFYYIVGRISRFIKLFGYRYDLDEIEKKISKLGNNCAVLGNDETLDVFITKNFNKTKLMNFIFKNFKIRKSLVSIKKISKIPRNRNGKILYSELKKILNYV